jgi:transcriptional regulator with XRE-family HTH domain
MKPRAPVQPVGRTLWRRVGARIRARRTHFGFTNQRLADALGIDLRTYDAYEAGVEQVPAWVLTELAELLAVSMLWFFQDVTFEKERTQTAVPAAESGADGVYCVATLEERMSFLADSFCQLDLEGQQHLIAIVGALTRSRGKCTTD